MLASSQSMGDSLATVATMALVAKSWIWIVCESDKYAILFVLEFFFSAMRTLKIYKVQSKLYLMRWGDMNSVRQDPRTSLVPYATMASSPALKTRQTSEWSK